MTNSVLFNSIDFRQSYNIPMLVKNCNLVCNSKFKKLDEEANLSSKVTLYKYFRALIQCIS